MKIIFMGSPYFAVPALEGLINSEHEIIAVYTKAPKPAGRGQSLSKSPIHKLAESNGLQVLTPKSLRPEEEKAKLQEMKPDIMVVAAYGLILDQEVLSIPKKGCINIHPSDLPRWRGAAPLQRTIMAGDRQSAVCIMDMEEGIDTGAIIKREHFPIPEQMTAKELHDFCAKLGAKLLLDALRDIESGKAVYTPQSQEGVKYAAKLTHDEEYINWKQEARLVNAQIRGLSPKPGAYFNFNGEIIKIITAEYDNDATIQGVEPGEVIDDKLTVACSRGILKPQLVQRMGRKMIYRDAFLRGFSIPKGSNLNPVE